MERYPALQDVVTVPARRTHTASVIFLHGLGQSNVTWRMVILEALAPRLPDIQWLLPQAPRRRNWQQHHSQPSWFNSFSLPPGSEEIDEQSMSESTNMIEDLILSQVYAGIDSRRIILVGFSQGAALSLMVALTSLHYLGGVVSLSGWIPHQIRSQIVHSTSTNPPILWCHGARDREVPVSLGQDAVGFLQNAAGYTRNKLQVRVYENMGHAIDDAELEDILYWIGRILGSEHRLSH